ncbi:hypothetical protein K470DRAFT_259716 [Piedraia hortae CBS 480.64]|uniref:MFS general substrate transporter n=1 Tax=Piedraia hortae CBS 480.64 TaxID=1314780 RepID=A0A6A7BVM6_9PEZI|nr:hypothetical protein K470DRAFT_259716 [Piedraia hortae CBS 480.64]
MGVFPGLTATPLQATAYLGGVALFSIAFLVFLNSSISFVVTDLIGQKTGVGDAVGTLGFADELFALVACPLWGLLSDRVGIRAVAVTGYCVVAVSLICLVQSTNVYPQLLLGRLAFSLGAAACSTMVTAALPAMVARPAAKEEDEVLTEQTEADDGNAERASRSDSSEVTITPNMVNASQDSEQDAEEASPKPVLDTTAGISQLAGLVGLFTGLGALIALLLFLPLPAHLRDSGSGSGQSVQVSFYIVAAVAACVAIFVFFGLSGLPGEEGKRVSAIWSAPYDEMTKTGGDGHLHTILTPKPSYVKLVKESLKLGVTDPDIFLGYLGGFVARASSVGISLFIPLFVNSYFLRNGLCTSDPGNPTDIRESCKRAYVLASILTGIAETAALICAPLFGLLGGKWQRWPLFGASVVGLGGYIAFGFLQNPNPSRSGGHWAFIAAILIGISQIGSVVCSLGLLSRGIHRSLPSQESSEGENTPLLPHAERELDRPRLRGSIAGMYSMAGGGGILLLTKLGGALFDSWMPGAPFFLLAIFNAVLIIAIVIVQLVRGMATK